MRLRFSEVEISSKFHPVLQILLPNVIKSDSRTYIHNIMNIFCNFQAFLQWFVSLRVAIPYDLELLSEVAISEKLTSKTSISYKNHEKNHEEWM